MAGKRPVALVRKPRGKRRAFPGISPLAWQHPSDLEALEALRRVPALDQALKFVSANLYEKAFLVESVGSRVRLGPKQAPRIWNLFREAADILDMPKLPQVYLATSNSANAYAFGMKEYTITIHSALVDMMTEEELMSVIGHELSHIKCEHMLYRSLAIMITRLGGGFLGIGRLALFPLELALLAWARRAELTCDRAALLVVQDSDVVARALAKLAGMSSKRVEELDMQEIYRQADEYEKTFDDQIVTKAFKYLGAAFSTHPVPVWRAKVIHEWSKSRQYEEILAGRYLTVAQARREEREAQPSGPAPRGKCAGCRAPLESIFSFCPSCGASVDAVLVPCDSCGKKIEPEWPRCPHCAASR